MKDHLDSLSRSTAQNEPSDDHEESLSLCDLPFTPPRSSTTVELPPPPTLNHSRQSSSSDDFFFKTLINSDDNVISPADDVIFRGRLLPFAPPPPRRSLSLSSALQHRSESMSLLADESAENCRKLRRNCSSQAELLPRNSSKNCHGMKTPWYVVVFGLPVKIPAEIELKDIKNRKFRRRIRSEGSFSGYRCSSASWKLLSVLSCRNHANIDVRNTTSFRI